MSSIFTITVISGQDSKRKYNHCMGFFSSLEDAQKSVIGNDLDLFEQSDDLAVIEEFEPGVYPEVKSESWYQADHKGVFGDPIVTAIDKPYWVKTVSNFAMG